MNIEINISDKKTELLGVAMAKMFKLKKDKQGNYITKYGHLSAKGIGNSIMITVEETISHGEEQLSEFLNKLDKSD